MSLDDVIEESFGMKSLRTRLGGVTTENGVETDVPTRVPLALRLVVLNIFCSPLCDGFLTFSPGPPDGEGVEFPVVNAGKQRPYHDHGLTLSARRGHARLLLSNLHVCQSQPGVFLRRQERPTHSSLHYHRCRCRSFLHSGAPMYVLHLRSYSVQ